MRIKIDEDLPRAVATLLVTAGYTDARSVADQGMCGWADSAPWQAVQKEGRFLITADKGFADVRSHPPGGYAGVLLLRPDADGVRPLLKLMYIAPLTLPKVCWPMGCWRRRGGGSSKPDGRQRL